MSLEARDLVALQDENRIKRKNGLKKISYKIEEILANPEADELEEDLITAVSKNLSDSSEVNRELATNIIHTILQTLQVIPTDYYAILVPILNARLGLEDVFETCEEIRVAQVNILSLLAIKAQPSEEERVLTAWMTEFLGILVKTSEDPFSDIRKASHAVIRTYVDKTKRTVHLMAEGLLKPLLKCFTHQHSKVRCSAIETIGIVVMHGGKTCLPDKICSHLAQRLFDDHPNVRMAVLMVAVKWLTEYIDRYSFWGQCMPLILTGFYDSDPNIAAASRKHWELIGKQYEKENEEKLKERLEFPQQRVPAKILEKEQRFCYGCRDLVGQVLHRLLPGIKNDLQDWKYETKLAAAKLFKGVLVQGEQLVTQHFQVAYTAILNSIDRCQESDEWDEDDILFNLLRDSAELLGVFTFDQTLWLKSTADHAGTVSATIILAAILRSKPQDAELVETVQEILLSRDVARRLQPSILAQDALLDVASFCDNFDTLVSLAGVTKDRDGIALKAERLLVEHHGGFNRAVEEADALVDTLDSDTWLTNSVDLNIFVQLFQWIMKADQPVLTRKCYDMLRKQLQAESEPENRVAILMLLARIFQIINNCQVDDVEIVENLFKPSLKWRAGRSQVAARSAAAAALWSYTKLFTDFAQLEQILLPEIVSILDDDLAQTRHIACKLVEQMILKAGSRLSLDGFYHKIYVELAKRLDDVDDGVRRTSLNCWRSLFKVILDKPTKEYDAEGLYSAHWEYIFEKLLLHMDDPDEAFRKLVFDALSEGSQISGKILASELRKVRAKHRDQDLCNKLESLLIT